ncbi:colanic acid biosynthesis glycosyl transferase WcaI [Granulicella rosea]|uniref:Colanic acid biosynthesis glycosyl transferase WcaI n=1 Tax=Granulicella rosea TaxID=474952 RepID=A0A239MLK9_9BACT|nr:glycosyltransferase WbuB [Granulicella rosea]SNT43360.1 colanic acid biosynthesis glycosyl transferase WcaI [Granulicella rosea]
MRILIYGLNYSPELTGIGKYSGEMGEWLIERGHEVRVVTAPPYYPAWKVWDDYLPNRYRTEKGANNSVVYRCPIYVPAVPTGMRRMAHLLSFMLSSLPVLGKLATWEPDIVITVEPTFFCAPIALLFAAFGKSASWLHIQDFEVDAAFDLGLLPAEGFLHWLALELEDFFTHTFSRVSSISRKMVERAVIKGVDPANAVLFPNWVDTDFIHPLTGPNSFRRELRLDDKIVLLYSGNLGNKQGLEILDPLCQSFKDNDRVHFLICGDGALRPHLEELAGRQTNITLLPLQPLDRLNELLNAADIHLLPQRAGAADLVMPSKLTGMLSSGRPVVATAVPDTQVAYIIAGDKGHAPAGLIVNPDDAVAFQGAIQKLIDDPELRATLGAAGRAFAVDQLGKTAILLRFEQSLLELRA